MAAAPFRMDAAAMCRTEQQKSEAALAKQPTPPGSGNAVAAPNPVCVRGRPSSAADGLTRLKFQHLDAGSSHQSPEFFRGTRQDRKRSKVHGNHRFRTKQ